MNQLGDKVSDVFLRWHQLVNPFIILHLTHTHTQMPSQSETF